MNDALAPIHAALPAEDAAALRADADEIRMRLRRTAEDVVAIGAALQRAKARLPHGAFGPWLAVEFGMSERSARRFIQASDYAVGKSATVAEMPLTTLYSLSALSTPAPVREQAERMIAAGETVTAEDVRRMRTEAASPIPAGVEEEGEAPARDRARLTSPPAGIDHRGMLLAAASAVTTALEADTAPLGADLAPAERDMLLAAREALGRLLGEPDADALAGRLVAAEAGRDEARAEVVRVREEAEATRLNLLETLSLRERALAEFYSPVDPRGALLAALRSVVRLGGGVRNEPDPLGLEDVERVTAGAALAVAMRVATPPDMLAEPDEEARAVALLMERARWVMEAA